MKHSFSILFILIFACCRGDGAPVDLCKVMLARAGGAPIILVVDDEPGVRLLLSMQVEMRGHTVVPAESIREAKEYVEQLGTVTAALIDVNLRGEDGTDLASYLSAGGIPVALVSGAFSETRGGTDQITLPKPYSPMQLNEVLENLLQRASARSRAAE